MPRPPSTASLEFPDQVEFARVPVKHPTVKTLLVRNVGTRDAKFTLATQAPFSVEPAQGFLPVGKSMQVNVSFACEVGCDVVRCGAV